jgi:hypothetical protein
MEMIVLAVPFPPVSTSADYPTVSVLKQGSLPFCDNSAEIRVISDSQIDLQENNRIKGISSYHQSRTIN